MLNGSATSNELRMFHAHQRAVGEVMVHPDGEPGRRRCLGYAEFSLRLDTDTVFRAWFIDLMADVDRIAANVLPAVPRLKALQHELVALIELLDPDRVQFPRFRDSFDHGRLPGTPAGPIGGWGRSHAGGSPSEGACGGARRRAARRWLG